VIQLLRLFHRFGAILPGGLSWRETRGGIVTAPGQVGIAASGNLVVHLDPPGPPSYPQVGRAVSVQLLSPDGIYRLPGQVLTLAPAGTVRLRPTGPGQRWQQRRFPRLPLLLPAAVAPLETADPSVHRALAQLLDCSAGGVRLAANGALEVGDRLRLGFWLDQGEPLTPTVRVVATGAAAGPLPLILRGRFDTIDEPARRRIFHYVRQELARQAAARAPAQPGLPNFPAPNWTAVVVTPSPVAPDSQPPPPGVVPPVTVHRCQPTGRPCTFVRCPAESDGSRLDHFVATG
jgi:PilZ domain-containing protein